MNIKNITKLGLAICDQDGIISDMELSTLSKLLEEKISTEVNETFTEKCMEEYFSEEKNLDEYIRENDMVDNKGTLINIYKEAATSDGLDPEEKIGLDILKKAWDLN